MYWNTITSIDRGLRYVARLGFTVSPGYPGWIVAAQERMCFVERKLWLAAHAKFPYKAHYHRKDRQFRVKRQNGEVVTIDARKL